MKNRINDALGQLETVNEKTIRVAGPRYSPGVNPAAPNIEIDYLIDAFDALSLSDGWWRRLQSLAERISEAGEYRSHLLGHLFSRRIATPAKLVNKIQSLEGYSDPTEIRCAVNQLRRSSGFVARHLAQQSSVLWGQLQAMNDEDADHEQLNRLQSDIRAIGEVSSAVDGLIDYLDGPSGNFLRGSNGLLLLGSWGTGKTHFLCDIARQRQQARTPALLVMASSLPPCANVLDAIADSTGLSTSGASLLSELNRLGEATNTRALLMIDAINEGDQEVWRDQLHRLTVSVSKLSHVGLVVSCRQPFDEAIVTERAAKRFWPIEHHGFQDLEFDAQLEFFSFYNLEAPSVPLITPEFTRPLFLKILCEGIKDLSRRSQQSKLREIATGQKGMTYVLEYYTNKVGRGIERDLDLAQGSCWKALKGDRDFPGFAGRMARSEAEWLSKEEAIASLQESLSLTEVQSENLLQRFVHEGLVTVQGHWHNSQLVSGIQFSYQRFGDHLIARHLLGALPANGSEQAIRRCFYRNRPLGAPFKLDQWGQQFKQPGVAAALMIEFPERLKRSPLSCELLNYLPKASRVVAPIKEVFLDGLYWRTASAFTEDTDRLVSYFLNQEDDWTANETFEVLVGLATRPHHPYAAKRLATYLGGLTMAVRDQTWSEYLRRTDSLSNVQRIIAWVERSSAQDDGDVRNEIRLLSLFLTTTVRPLRDLATRALVNRGAKRPGVLFDEVLQSLAFNDPYVPERMLAAAYGVAMRFWADPTGEAIRTAIVPFARSLVRLMFLPDAPYATKHALSRGYAIGVTSLARKINPRSIATQYVPFLRSPFTQIQSPFVSPDAIDEEDLTDCRQAMHMDFENYTIGRLVPDRGNYQEAHTGFQDVRRQIARRMSDLGFSSSFSELDRSIAQMQPMNRENDGGKTDRYGKKYSWIAFFEMYGVRSDLGLLGEWRSRERPADADIDPSFPVSPQEWVPPLPEIFIDAPTDHETWLSSGPVPQYQHLLFVPRIEGVAGGPWVLLNGFFQQAGSHDRETVTFIRGLFLRREDITRIKEQVSEAEYLGNMQIPGPSEDYYTYAGEIPWSPSFGGDSRLASGRARRQVSPILERFSGGRWTASGRVEVPVHRWSWESHHSDLNQVSGVEFVTPALAENLGLVNYKSTFDLWDRTGRQATVYREFDVAKRFGNSNLLFLRKDLLEDYLADTKQTLIWIPWGERTLHYRYLDRSTLAPAVHSVLQSQLNNFGELIEYGEVVKAES
jgi:hypothetical protein